MQNKLTIKKSLIMKKFLYVALMTFVMIGMSACSKDTDLVGTKWAGQLTMEEEGMTITADLLLEFTTETAGKLTTSASFMGQQYSDTQDFTYTYDGKSKGTLTMKYDDGDEDTTDFTVDGDELTITDDGMTVVFKKK